MFGWRSSALATAVALAACGDDTASSGSAGGSTTGTSSTASTVGPATVAVEPRTSGTTGSSTGEAVDPCECEAPVVHEGDLEVADLAAYQGACLVEVIGTVKLEGIGDPSLLSSLAHLRRAWS